MLKRVPQQPEEKGIERPCLYPCRLSQGCTRKIGRSHCLPMPCVDASQVNFGLFQGEKPLLVVADPSPGSTAMRETMYELNTRMPRKVRNGKVKLSLPPGVLSPSNRANAVDDRI